VRPSLAFQPTPLLCHAPHNSRSPLTRRRSAARPACWPTSRPSGPSILRRAPILPTAGARRSPTRSTRPCFVRPPQRLSFLLEPLLTYRSRSAYRSLWHADARYPRPAGDLRLGSPRSSQCRSGPALVGSRRRRVGAARQGASCSTFMAPVSRLCVLLIDLALAWWPLPVLPRAPALRPGRIPRLVSVTRASTRPTSRFSLTLSPGIPSLTHTIDSTLQPCMSPSLSLCLFLNVCLSLLAMGRAGPRSEGSGEYDRRGTSVALSPSGKGMIGQPAAAAVDDRYCGQTRATRRRGLLAERLARGAQRVTRRGRALSPRAQPARPTCFPLRPTFHPSPSCSRSAHIESASGPVSGTRHLPSP